MNKKEQLGQFFTTNTDYILQGFEYLIKGENITDPFAGHGDLLDWAAKNGAKSTKGYDVDESKVDNLRVYYNDSIKKPKKYDFVLTNPPYLYQNKMNENSILMGSRHTDLFQISLEKIMQSTEGIVIVPINFFSADNSKYIRDLFLHEFEIIDVNYFTEQVFAETTYNVISFYYRKKEIIFDKMTLNFSIYPEQKEIKFTVFEKYNWQIGGEFLHEIEQTQKILKMKRLEDKDIISGKNELQLAYNHVEDKRIFNIDDNTLNSIQKNIIILKAIDTGTENGKICLQNIKDYNINALVSKKTSRNQIQIIFKNNLLIEEQKIIIAKFNELLNKKRKEYFSLFMTNYRDNNRKRISFKFAYDLINYVYISYVRTDTYVEKQQTLFG